MNILAGIENLNGLLLVTAIAGLLLIEETGIPLLFAPGDIMLAIGGIGIAAGRVQPWIFVPAAGCAILAGAMLDRELFALIGWQRARRLARRLRAERALDRVAALLGDGGWRTVFVVRLIPGLRIHTSEVAGLTQMPRRTFFAGLLAATAVYLAAFVGLGAAIGRPVLTLMHQGEHEAFVGGLVLGAAAVTILLLRRRLQAMLVSLDLAQWRQAFRWQRPTPVLLALVPVAIGLDYAGHALVKTAGLPLFVDSVGTILVGVLAGPWAGGLAGFITNLISANTVDPIAAPYSIVSLLLGFAAGVAGYAGWPSRRQGWVTLAMLAFAIASLGSAPLNLALYHGQSGVLLGDAIGKLLLALHLPSIVAAFVDEATADLPDKVLSVFLVYLLYRSIPAGWTQRATTPNGRRQRETLGTVMIAGGAAAR